MADADKTIIIQYLVKAQEAITDATKLRIVIDEMKVSVLQSATAQKTALKDLEMAWGALSKKLEKIDISKALAGKSGLGPGPGGKQAQVSQIKAQYAAQREIMKAAFDEAKKDEQAYFNYQASLGKQEVSQKQQTEKQKTQAVAEGVQNRLKNIQQQVVTSTAIDQQDAQAYKTMVANKKKDEQEWQSFLASQKKNEQAVAQQTTQNKLKNIQQQVAAQKELDKANQSNTKSTTTFGDVAKYVFGTILGLSAIQILRQIVQWLGQAAQSGYEFTKALFQLGIGVNALRRAGIDVTFAEITDNLERLRQKFKIFSTKELIEGSAAFFNLHRDLGLTKDKLFELQDAVATLAIVNGRAMDDVQRTVALAISSGYTEGLQRLGVSINRVNITQEAMRIGFKGSYLALTEQERALATYNLLIEKTAKYGNDLAEYYKTLPGSIDVATSKISDQKKEAGELLLPVTLLGKYLQILGIFLLKIVFPVLMVIKAGQDFRLKVIALYQAILKLTGLGPPIEKLFLGMRNLFVSVTSRMQQKWNEFVKDIKNSIKDVPFLKNFFALFDEYQKKLDKLKKREEIDIIPAEDNEKIVEASQKLVDEIKDIQESAKSAQEKAEIDLQRDLERIDRDAARDRLEIEYDLQNDLLEVRVKAGHDAYDLYLKYQFDLAQLATDTQDKIADAQRKYKQKELEAERDYQEKLRRLREDFLFDLEDALRERDALQVIRLTRRFNLEQARLEREKNNEAQTRKEQFENELKDIQDQRKQREAELRKEFEFRIAEIQREMFREIAAKEAQAAIERDQLERNLLAQKEERDIQHQQQMDDLTTQTNNRLSKIAQTIADEYKLTKDGIDELKALVAAELGPNSYIDQVLLYLYNSAARAAAAIKDAMDLGTSLPNQMPNQKEKEGGDGSRGFATGGMAVIRKPTIISVGEREAEVLSVAPLSKLQRMLGVPSGGGMNRNRDGKLTVQLFLSPDLEARIVDNTMDQMSDVFVNIQGSRST